MDSGEDLPARSPAPYLTKVDIPYTFDEAERLLRKVTKNHPEFMITEPPVRPTGGDVYVYRCKSKTESEKMDFRFDQYRWISKGSNSHSSEKKKVNVLKRYYYIKDPKGKKKDSLTGFKRDVYCLKNSTDGVFLVHYTGDSTLAKDTPHGNSKSKTKMFIPTKKSVFSDIKSKIELSKPQALYKHLHEKREEHPLPSVPVVCPRDRKQVENYAFRYRGEKKLCNDEFFSLYELGLHTNFVHQMTMLPALVVHVGNATAITLAKDLLRESIKNNNLPQLLSYDTTFNLGDFYVSPLVMRNTMLEGNPIFPVMFLIHEKKYAKDHAYFLLEALKVIIGDSAFPNIPIVTDRERGITAALKDKFPGLHNVVCRNHILKDIEIWVKKKGGKLDDIKVLKDDIEQLLNSDTVLEFDEKFRKLHKRWTKGFLDYVELYLKRDMLDHGCNFITSRFAAFSSGTTPTNNISESFNRVLKEQTDFTEWPIDTMVLSLYYLQNYYLYEFARAYKGLGNYSRKAMFLDRELSLTYTDVCQFETPKEIISSIKQQHTVIKGVESNPTLRLSQQAMARMVVQKGHIGFSAQTSSFTVLDIHGKGVNAVKVFPRPSKCTCPSTGLCYHILAVHLAIGSESDDNKLSYSLSVMRRRARGKGNKSGRKKPRLHDYDYLVEPAEDSMLAESGKPSPVCADVSGSALPSNLDDVLVGTPLACSTPVPGEATVSEQVPPSVTHQWDKDHRELLQDLKLQMENLAEDRREAVKTLEARQWLCSNAIDDSIEIILERSGNKNACLLLPTYIYQCVAAGQYEVPQSYIGKNEAMNKDIFLMPLNLDPKGTGIHWCLGVGNIPSKEILLFDSMAKKPYEACPEVFANLVWVIEAAHLLAGVPFIRSSWSCIFVTDTVQQKNGYDCGIYVILNAHSAITGNSYGEISSEHVRQWLQLNLLQYQRKSKLNVKREKHEDKINTRTTRLIKGIQKILPPILCFSSSPVFHRLTSMLKELELSRNLTVCADKNCRGNFSSSSHVLCVLCREWYHTECVHYNPSVKYFNCSDCST